MKPEYVSITLRSEKEKNKHCKQTTQDKSKKTGKKKQKKNENTFVLGFRNSDLDTYEDPQYIR